ncbi:helix-turn-helix domain-containing protein [Gordonia sp. (in: high G+C Gram-positive bacteria)]|uniref:sigma-54-dependent Fis family transcriptional regulator n=1 Tax=Gordonia sp. (in: high G+C Gram-positive bacteria) TaxID=84139 RepID=UPI0016AFB295|nr:helix-turn-helix domain-containing protein [Gordonia sp. (in: high G+C Gram-positive bacteria)]NLG45245.1 GAF domain-containing protein [Gordonia sp. (in: high G+C Gram-positive bacteria)]
MIDRDIEVIRQQFLSDQRLNSVVREPIAKSWMRSKALELASEGVAVPFLGEPDLDSILVAAADPVMANLAESLSDESISIILTSDEGVVLSRSAHRTDLRDDLDDVRLAPGFSYSEQFVGTNGIGTTLETRRPTLVVGSEHYSDALCGLSCAGAPIFHPVSGALLGVLDMTGRAGLGGQVMLSLAQSTAREIEANLLQRSGEGHVAAFNAYLTVRRRNPSAMFIVLGDDMSLMNEKLRRTLDSADQTALIEFAIDGAQSRANSLVETLPSGTVVRLTRIEADGATLALFVVRLVDDAVAAGGARRALTSSLPGLVGRSTAWRLACDELRQALRSGVWVAVVGEPGSGRCSSLRAAVEAHRSGFVRVFDAADLAVGSATLRELEDEVTADGFSVIVRDVDQLSDEVLAAIADLFTGVADNGWVGVTMRTHSDTVFDTLIVPHFARTVMIPALRHRISDLQELVPQLLRELTAGGSLDVTPAAMRILSAYGWPGNVAQLRNVLRKVIRQRRTGTIDVDGLPPEVRSFGRKTLSAIESMERDAIVEALKANSFDKGKAAADLGMSRATIYRRIKRFSIAV